MMVRWFLRLLLRHRWAVIAVACVWAIVGIGVALHTPVDAVPDLSENQVLVYADWPGQNPPEIERQITRPLSLALQGIPGVRTVRGSSDVGFSLLHLIFEDHVSFAAARERVSAQLAAADVKLPVGVTPRLAADGIPTGQIFWYTVEGTDTDLAELRTLQDTIIAPQLRSVTGVAEVASVGGFVVEYHIVANPVRLEQERLSLAEFTKALQAAIQPAAGQAIQSANAELLVRMVTLRIADAATDNAISTLQTTVLSLSDGRTLPLISLASVRAAASPRRGAFEKDGHEAVAGIVHLRYGHNPLAVTTAVRQRLQQIATGLPRTVRMIPCYDRTPLITGAVSTVTRTLLESMIVTSICIIVVLRHWRTSLVIVLTLPLAVLGAFLGMAALRQVGLADVQTNIMSLAGIVVSIGVLVDSSIVVAENITHQLRRRFGNEPVTGNVTEVIVEACATVARPAFFAVVMMVVSFLPVFALQGIDGRMYRPLAWTKTLALLSVAVLTVTLVPVLCSLLIRGRVHDESESRVVRSVVRVYQPILQSLLQHPWPLVGLLCVTFILAAAALGGDLLLRMTTVLAIALLWWQMPSLQLRVGSAVVLLAIALTAQSAMKPLGLALRFPLDEGMVMDMPITIPRVTITQAVDDLKARNMILCRFPEVHMVTGKVGRAETPFDPAPVDMIETMVEFRPHAWWPSRRLLPADATRQAARVVNALAAAELVEPPSDLPAITHEIVDAGLVRFDAIQREVAWQHFVTVRGELSRSLSTQLVDELARRWSRSKALSRPLDAVEIAAIADQLPLVDRQRLGQLPDADTIHVLRGQVTRLVAERGLFASEHVSDLDLQTRGSQWANPLRRGLGFDTPTVSEELLPALRSAHTRQWQAAVRTLNADLRHRASATWTQIVCSELFARQAILDPDLTESWKQVLAARYGAGRAPTHHTGGHIGLSPLSHMPIIDPHPKYDAIIHRCTEEFSRQVWLWPHDTESLTRNGGELDRAVQMPGWANVWTRPIQNRVDMLTTGVNSEVGIRVLGRDFEAVVQASEHVAEAIRTLPGAADVVADPIRGKSYLEVQLDPAKVAAQHVSQEDVQQRIAAATSGLFVSHWDDGDVPRTLRVVTDGHDAESLASLPLRNASSDDVLNSESTSLLTLGHVAEIRIKVGPATIKSENGWLRNYVRLNVRGRDPAEFVAAAQQELRQRLSLPHGVFLEWTGQYEHATRTRTAMLWLMPAVLLLILAILYITFRDWADAGLMLLSVPGALAGGVLCQWVMGYPFTVAIGVGYIACFGMAAATSMVMLVYLREAIHQAGGLERMSLDELRHAVMSGAVHRLRPKLLTEVTTILSLAPMFWSTGAGADVIAPMAAPVLGGLLIADEVVDLLLPITFFHVRRLRWQRLQVSAVGVEEQKAFA